MNQEIEGSLSIKYQIEDEKTVILSCTGTERYVRLPEDINGNPVVSIAPYSFSSPEDNIRKLKDQKIHEYEIEGIDTPLSVKDIIKGKKLQAIYLPGCLARIGEYAFYNCTELEHINLGEGVIDFGNGAFMNCDSLKELTFRTKYDTPTGLAGFLRELQSELIVTFEGKEEKAVFIFPEYYEESIENTPARVFHYQIHGAGYRYRQCLENGILNVSHYDMLFQAPEIRNESRTALSIALCRLNYPAGLSEHHKQQYINYLRLHKEDTIIRYLEENNTKGLYSLKQVDILTGDMMDFALKASIRLKQPECTAVLLSLGEESRKPAEDKFDF
ncbi:leucine-rich repeat domain-containing protein [Anaerocolumna sp. AGMB13020]|uniref:leucine-rich repeat domain-containing protein n=1 Tax=Anaerocolumna sp. AGMB13020 TaxID=3081750 RepID=UPI002955DB37|nr:leucine-rich repeat domain-containing protein [Anaerocolumna sp. AGMB13020]WOO36795.1 leucine-rich repeat domain-containing protein [Anaerocolumna sp. AGMB13020]